MTTLSPLLFALANLTATEPRPEAQATATALRAGADTDFPPQKPSALATGIRRASTLTDAHPLARLVGEAQPWLPWQDSPAASLQPPALRAIKSIVTLLGPDAPIYSDTLLFGLFYQEPGSYYPLHAHEAAETYTILAGSAFWQAGDRRLTLSAGEAIHHPPNLPHAMRASPEGFLAIWRWSGDIAFDSYRMLPDPET
jgi:mannose-6-phosphate isomerase-like protein (cupin superfamily)